MKHICFLLWLVTIPLQAASGRWGWGAHRYINGHAADYLPVETTFFEHFSSYLSDHATDPDTDSQPGYYHYIDIDYYDEFFTGQLPHDWDQMVALYGEEVVIQYGTIPWVIENWTDSLTFLMANGRWAEAKQVAAELGHYVADSHEPLHLTLNYNGQNSGNDGIHSRYETTMVNAHLDQLPLPDSTGIYWINLIDSVFSYIDVLYPNIDMIMAADDLASQLDPSYGETYYEMLWGELDSITTMAIQRAILDLASIWYTAWINAGSPVYDPLKVTVHELAATSIALHPNYPNPFNPVTTVAYELPETAPVTLTIYDILGRQVFKLVDNRLQPAGYYRATWDGRDGKGLPLPSGIYIARLSTPDYTKSIKMLLLK